MMTLNWQMETLTLGWGCLKRSSSQFDWFANNNIVCSSRAAQEEWQLAKDKILWNDSASAIFILALLIKHVRRPWWASIGFGHSQAHHPLCTTILYTPICIVRINLPRTAVRAEARRCSTHHAVQLSVQHFAVLQGFDHQVDRIWSHRARHVFGFCAGGAQHTHFNLQTQLIRISCYKQSFSLFSQYDNAAGCALSPHRQIATTHSYQAQQASPHPSPLLKRQTGSPPPVWALLLPARDLAFC